MTLKEHLTKIGQARSERKRLASVANLAKARAAKVVKNSDSSLETLQRVVVSDK